MVYSLASVNNTGLTTFDYLVSFFPIFELLKLLQIRDTYKKEFNEAMGGVDATLPDGYCVAWAKVIIHSVSCLTGPSQ